MKNLKVFTILLILVLLCSLAIVFVACDLTNKDNPEENPNIEQSHTHVWSDTLTIGAETHWYGCEGCEQKKDEGNHSFATGICECGKYIEGTSGLSYTLRSNEDLDSYEVRIGEANEEENIVIASYFQGKPVTSIARQGFAAQNKIKSVVIPESVEVINDGAFYKAENLKNVVIPEGVTTIGQYAFRDCISLKQIHLPDSVVDMADSVFYNCTELTNVVLSNSLEVLKNNLFRNCQNLEKINFGTKTKSIGVSAFQNCQSILNIELPSNVKSIGANAFSYASGLISITLGAQIESMGKNAFASCNALTIYCESEEQSTSWDSEWNSSNCPVVWNSKNNDVANDGNIYFVSDNVRYALKENIAIVAMQSTALSGTIVVADNLTYKGNLYEVTGFYLMSAFADCKNIESIEIGANITTINSETFYNCSKLKQVKFGAHIVEIQSWAFAKCSELQDIYFEGSIEQWKTLLENSETDWDEMAGNYTIHCTNGNISTN